MNVAALQSASHNSFSSQFSAVSPSTSCLFLYLCFPPFLFFVSFSFSFPPPSVSLSVSVSSTHLFLFASMCLSPFTLPFCFLYHIYEELKPYLFSAAGCLTWKNFKSFESRVGGEATGKGIKTRRLREERWEVSWTAKFLRFPETDWRREWGPWVKTTL